MALKSKEKMLLFFAVIAAIIWAFDYFYYTPQKKKIKALKEEIKAADVKLKESVLFIKGVETVETEVTHLENELKRLNERMLRGEEFRTFLKHLGRDSDRLRIKMISLTSREEKIPPPEGKKETSPLQYKKINIQMVLHSTFAALGTYLKGIEELPFLVTIEDLQVERLGEITPFLKVTMGLTVYVIT